MKTIISLAALAFAGCSACGPMVQEDVRVIALKHVDAAAVSRTLRDEFKHPNSTLTEIAADSRTNRIIAKGYPFDLDRLETRVQELDQSK